MATVLILTHYFPPCPGVSTLRIASWAREFPKYDLYPIVLTRHWHGNEKTWSDYLEVNLTPRSIEERDGGEVIRLPYHEHPLTRRVLHWPRVLRAPAVRLSVMLGLLSPEINYYWNYRQEVMQLIAARRPDCVVISSPPFNMLKLCADIRRAYDIPVVVDFRDLWSNYSMIQDHEPGMLERYQMFWNRHYIKRWCREASRVLSVSGPLSDVAADLTGVPGLTIYNGYARHLFDDMPLERTDTFHVTYIGTLHARLNNLTMLYEAMAKFLADKSPKQVQLNFIGVRFIPDMAAQIEAHLPAAFLNITYRLPHDETVSWIRRSQVLWYGAVERSQGLVSTKIFEYLASQRHIILGPGDGDIVDRLVRETQTGWTATSAQDMYERLQGLYKRWLQEGDIVCKGNQPLIETLSREKQAEILVAEIHRLIDNRRLAIV